MPRDIDFGRPSKAVLRIVRLPRRPWKAVVRYVPLGAFALLILIPGCRTTDGRLWFDESPPTYAPTDQTTRRIPDGQYDAGRTTPTGPAGTSSGPAFPGGKPSATNLTLTVAAPRQVQLGRPALFDVAIRNNGTATVNAARIAVSFGDGLRFPGKTEQSFDQQLAPLPPGKTHTVALMLRGEALGTHCARFRLTLDGRETVWKSVCVQVVPRQYAVSLAVAPLRTVGGRTEFTLSLTNVAKDELHGATVSVEFDPRQLKPLSGSHGARVESGRLTWAVNRLRPGVGVHVQGEMECRVASPQVCLTAYVAAANAPSDREAVCWQVIEQGRPFDMRIADTRDVVRVGEATEVVVSVQNRSGKRAALPTLAVQVPANFRVVSTSVWEGTQSLAGKAAVDKGAVAFPPVEMVDADGVITYRIRVEALEAGGTSFTAKVALDAKTVLELSEPVTVVR